MSKYPCLDPACSGFSTVLIPGHAKAVQSQGRLAVYFAKDNKAKYGHICSLCFQRCTPEEAKQYALYQYGVDGRAKASV